MRENKIKDYNQRLVIAGFMLALGLILPYVLAHGYLFHEGNNAGQG